MYQITVWRSDNDRRWYWHAQAGNHRITGDSGQGYASESAARRAAEAFRAGIAGAPIRVLAPAGSLVDMLVRAAPASRRARVRATRKA